MLNYAQKRAVEALENTSRVVLATNGPAGLLVSEFPCRAVGLNLYLLAPETSDHLFNLEHDSAVSLVTRGWELKGNAKIVASDSCNFESDAWQHQDTDWCVIIQVIPGQIQFRRETGWGNLETIDL